MFLFMFQLIYNGNKEVLPGWRNNLPARNYWFVPGGRIYKDESIRNALLTISARVMSGVFSPVEFIPGQCPRSQHTCIHVRQAG